MGKQIRKELANLLTFCEGINCGYIEKGINEDGEYVTCNAIECPHSNEFINGWYEGMETGEQEGIRKVVEWADEVCMEHGMRKKRKCDKCWQAQQKEWGIE